MKTIQLVVSVLNLLVAGYLLYLITQKKIRKEKR